MGSIRVAGAQINTVVGDLAGNEARILAAMRAAEEAAADVLLLPELAVTGYPPEDLVLRDAFITETAAVVERLATAAGACTVVVGYPARVPATGNDDAARRTVANAAAVLRHGAVRAVYHKVLLPSYGVFDESRYFARGTEPAHLVDVGGVPVGLSICEDLWDDTGPPLAQVGSGARVLVNISASPFHHGKTDERADLLRRRAAAAGVPLVYLNLVGGQDELVFDGGSMVVDATGELTHRSPQFSEDVFVVDIPLDGGAITGGRIAPRLDPDEEMYRALELGLADYVGKNGFPGVVVGLSGGLDSALTAVIAVDALGADRVMGVGMPSGFSSSGSVDDARALADNLGIPFEVVPIAPAYDVLIGMLAPVFGDRPFDTTEENLQARIRGMLLMAVSNKLGPMVLTTGNKSEVAVGYSTLYGDMVGGFSVLKDVFKTRAYALARWRNRHGEVIPVATIEKPPSAELRPGQTDQDSLPPYEVLDGILERYVERDLSVDEIVADGFDRATVRTVVGLVDRSEYKRRQAAPGVKVTIKAFGRDRRLPITNRHRST